MKEQKEEASAVSTPLKTITVGHKGVRSPTLTPVLVTTFHIRATSMKPLGLTAWEAVRKTKNDVQGRQL
jgi:hypothetical protein